MPTEIGIWENSAYDEDGCIKYDFPFSPVQKMLMYGPTGRISDIIGKVGYNKLLDHTNARNMEKLKLLHRFIGWAMEHVESEGIGTEQE